MDKKVNTFILLCDVGITSFKIRHKIERNKLKSRSVGRKNDRY